MVPYQCKTQSPWVLFKERCLNHMVHGRNSLGFCRTLPYQFPRWGFVTTKGNGCLYGHMFINKTSRATHLVLTALFTQNGESMLMEHRQSKYRQFCDLLTSGGNKHGSACREHIQRESSIQQGINIWIIFPALSSVGKNK